MTNWNELSGRASNFPEYEAGTVIATQRRSVEKGRCTCHLDRFSEQLYLFAYDPLRLIVSALCMHVDVRGT
jgi:hypothetical protein